MPVSNPLGGMMGRQRRVVDAAFEKYRIQRARTLWSLATMLLGSSLLVTGSALAWGWPGGLISAGAALLTLGVILGLTSAVPE